MRTIDREWNQEQTLSLSSKQSACLDHIFNYEGLMRELDHLIEDVQNYQRQTL